MRKSSCFIVVQNFAKNINCANFRHKVTPTAALSRRTPQCSSYWFSWSCAASLQVSILIDKSNLLSFVHAEHKIPFNFIHLGEHRSQEKFMRLLNPFTPNGRIVGGVEVEIEDVPYQASLQASGFAFCGGIIISKKWVMTAGHCIIYPTDVVRIRVGSNRKTKGGSLHSVKTIIRHENFKINRFGMPENDIAVINIKDTFKFDATRQPIPMFDQDEESQEGISAIISGWGAIRQGGEQSKILQVVAIPIISKKECNDAYDGIPEGQICAALPQGGKDSCQGDSGGPIAIQGRLAGIVSWGAGCAKPGYPGVYTEVAANRNWVRNKTGI